MVCFPGDAAIGSEQNVESAEQAKRTAVEKFNEDSIGMTLTRWQTHRATTSISYEWRGARNSELTSNGRQAGDYFQGKLS